MDEPCHICGDVGVLEAIITCSQCKIAHEHFYCRQTFSEDVPDVWLCEACEIGSMSSPRSLKVDLPMTLILSPSDFVDHENSCSAGPSKLPNHEKIVKTEKLDHAPTQEGKLCDICGNIGLLEAIMACCQCKIAREHIYCRKPFWKDDPDAWLCEACEMGSSVSPKSPMLMSDPLGMMEKKNTNSAGCSKLPKWEKIVKTGKVKYIPAQEAIMLSSGAKKCGSSKSNMHSDSSPSTIGVLDSATTSIKPAAIFPKSSLDVEEDPSFRPSGVSPTRKFNMLTDQAVNKQVTQTSKEPKEKKAAQSPAPSKENFPMEQPTDALMNAVETQNVSAKEDNVVNIVSSTSRQAMCFPPIVSSGKTCKISLTCLSYDFRHPGGYNDCIKVEPRNINAENGDRMTILPKADKYCQGPALDCSWKGSFKILDTVNRKELKDGFHAHPPSIVRRKVYEFSKAMPQVLLFTMLPRYNVWTEIFPDNCPGEADIGLYFFSSNNQRSAQYIVLLEFIETQDLVMRSYVDGVELLVFTSKLLSANSQRWNEEYFFWGIFRGVKKQEAVCKYNKDTPCFIQSSDCVQDNEAHGDDNVVGMEIDMLGGKDVGRVDIAISRGSSKGSYKSSGKEEVMAISLNTEIACVSRNFSFAVQKPLQDVGKELFNDIPPGFEEMHMLNVQNKAFSKMGREEKSLLPDGKARNREKESRRLESFSKAPRACRLQSKPDSLCY